MEKTIHNRVICLLAMAAMILAASSCTKDSLDNSGNHEAPAGYGLLSLGMEISAHAPVGRSIPVGPDDETGTPEESYIAAVRLVLYGYNDNIVKYAFDYKIRSRVTPADDGIPVMQGDGRQWTGFVEDGVGANEDPHLYWSESKSHFITYAREVAYEDYKLLLLVNPTKSTTDPARDLYKVTAVGKSLADFETAVSYAPTATASTYNQIRDIDGGIAADNYFLMNNHRGLIYVPAAKLRSSVESSNKNPIRVPISRAVSKVIVSRTLPQAYKANVYNLKWDLDVTNKKTYWTRKLTYLLTNNGSKGAMEEYGPTPVIDESYPDYPYYDMRRELLYAEDPNFTGLSSPAAPDPLDGATGDAREQKLRQMRWGEFNMLTQPGVNSWDEPADPMPALPNDFGTLIYCLENTVDQDDQYAGVVTTFLMSCNYWPAGYDDQEGYFIYNNYYLSPSNMRAYAAGDGTGLPTEIADLYNDIQKLLTDTGIDLKAMQTKSFASHNIRYYHDGLNYYTVPIKHHHNYPGRYGYYGVLRNNAYTIYISSINGPGWPMVSSEDNGNLIIEMKVLPWLDRAQFTVL